MMNQVLFSGRVVAFQPPKQLDGGMVVASVTLASDSTYNGTTNTTTVRVDFWNDNAKQVAAVNMGDTCLISGRLKSKAKAMNDGSTFYAMSISGSSLSILRGDAAPAATTQAPQQAAPPKAADLDVPF